MAATYGGAMNAGQDESLTLDERRRTRRSASATLYRLASQAGIPAFGVGDTGGLGKADIDRWIEAGSPPEM